MTRLWPKGTPIEVFSGSSDVPDHFTWQGQTHHIEEVTRRWRVDVGWWHRHIWRDCFKLTTKSGLLVVIYRDLQTGEWYLQRLYD